MTKSLGFCHECGVFVYDIEVLKHCRFLRHYIDKTVKQDLKKTSQYADQICKKFDFVTMKDKSERILYYAQGVYREGGEIVIKEQCQKLDQADCSLYIVRETTGHIQRKNYVKPEEFDRDHDVLNVINGLLNIGTGELKDHSPKYCSRVQLPVHYIRGADPVKIIKFLKEILPDPRDLQNLLEFCGSILLSNSPKLEKAALFTGGGSNGKSTFLDILGLLFGDTVSNISLHDIAYDKYAAAQLDGKLLNFRSDITNTEIEQIGRVNEVISGDRITVQRKFGQPFEMIPYAKLIFSANQPPQFNDDSDAAYRRWLIIDFVQIFVSNPTPEQKENGVLEKDPNIIKKLTSDEELSGLLNLLIHNARRVRKQKGIKHEQRTEDVRRVMKERANPVQAFVNECLILKNEKSLPKSYLYEIYHHWCIRNKKLPLVDRKFNSKLKQCIIINGDHKERFPELGFTNPVSSWKGVSIKKDVLQVPLVPHITIKETKVIDFVK